MYVTFIQRQEDESTIPHAVVEKHILEGKSLLRAWREYKGISQRDLAERMNISQSAYSQIERSHNHLRTSTLQKIANALGLQPEQLAV